MNTLQRNITSETEQNNSTKHIQLLRRRVHRARQSTQNANITWVNKERIFAGSEHSFRPHCWKTIPCQSLEIASSAPNISEGRLFHS
jgi:hypothetical protein